MSGSRPKNQAVLTAYSRLTEVRACATAGFGLMPSIPRSASSGSPAPARGTFASALCHTPCRPRAACATPAAVASSWSGCQRSSEQPAARRRAGCRPAARAAGRARARDRGGSRAPRSRCGVGQQRLRELPEEVAERRGPQQRVHPRRLGVGVALRAGDVVERVRRRRRRRRPCGRRRRPDPAPAGRARSTAEARQSRPRSAGGRSSSVALVGAAGSGKLETARVVVGVERGLEPGRALGRGDRRLHAEHHEPVEPLPGLGRRRSGRAAPCRLRPAPRRSPTAMRRRDRATPCRSRRAGGGVHRRRPDLDGSGTAALAAVTTRWPPA